MWVSKGKHTYVPSWRDKRLLPKVHLPGTMFWKVSKVSGSVSGRDFAVDTKQAVNEIPFHRHFIHVIIHVDDFFQVQVEVEHHHLVRRIAMYIKFFVLFIEGSIYYPEVFAVPPANHIGCGFEEVAFSVEHYNLVAAAIHDEDTVVCGEHSFNVFDESLLFRGRQAYDFMQIQE